MFLVLKINEINNKIYNNKYTNKGDFKNEKNITSNTNVL